MLEPELLKEIESVDPHIEVLYEPDLLGKPRYPCDQHGQQIKYTPENKKRWLELLSQTEIVFGYLLHTNVNEIPKNMPNFKWMQSPSAGIGQWVRQNNFFDYNILLTTASGIHATPLAEFVMMSMLWFVKDVPRMIAEKERRHWERYAGTTLKDKTIAVISLGSIGKEVARLAMHFGMHVIGTKRNIVGVNPSSVWAEKLYPWTDLKPMLNLADFIVLCLPLSTETIGLIGEEEFSSMKRGAVLINIARGAIVDEFTLIKYLNSGHLAGAALDVQANEPLPSDSPLWDLPKVLLSPHSGSNVDSENVELVKLFCENLRRYLGGLPLLNLFDKDHLY